MALLNKITYQVWRNHTFGQSKKATKRAAAGDGGVWTKFEKVSYIGGPQKIGGSCPLPTMEFAQKVEQNFHRENHIIA